MKLCTMIDVGRIRPEDIPPAADSSIDVLRIATYAHQMDEALVLLNDALNKGYETFINVMAVSTLPEKVDIFLHQLAGSGVHNVAIVDSFCDIPITFDIWYEISFYLGTILDWVHCHNNQQQALPTLYATDEGVDSLMPRYSEWGACRKLSLESLFISTTKTQYWTMLELTEYFVKLRYDLLWGYHMPYAITGYLNLHPRSSLSSKWYQSIIAEVVELIKSI